MNAQVWQRVQDLYHAALAQSPEAREAFIAHACESDSIVRTEVESLLAHEGRSDALLERPAWEHLPPPGFGEIPMIPGQLISHYRVVEALGEGGMGVVWRAFDSELNRHVAIKSLPAADASDEDRRARFLHEARSASALNHPNIVTIYDIFHQEGACFLVMELVEGQPLDRLIPRKGMPLKEALSCAIQIADALSAAHKIGIVHRDLKPANVMVTPSGRVKVLDFGLAKRVGPVPPELDPGTARPRTAHGIIAGTVSYMSPEQAEGKEVDTRSDIFSFGALLYEMITGTQAFAGPSAILTLSAILKEEPKPVSGIPADLPKTIARCLRKDPERRAQHIGDVRLALEDLKEELETARTLAPAGRRTWLRPGSVIVVAVIGLLASLLVYFTLRRQTPGLPPMNSQPLTTFPGNETAPALSPDGTQVAFSWDGAGQDNADIYVKLVAGGPPLRLTTNPARDHAPAWSPDGSQIAFLRSSGTGDVTNSVMLTTPLGGPEREFATLQSRVERNLPLAWTPDGKWIAFADQESPAELRYSIFKVSVAAREKRRLSQAPIGDVGDLRFAFSPDGQRLAIARHGTFSNADIYLFHLEPFQLEKQVPPRRIAGSKAAIGNIAWTPGGDEIVYSSDGSLWRCPVAALSEAAPLALAGVEGVANDPVISNSGRLVYSRTTFDNNLWSLNLEVPGAKPKQIAASTLLDDFPHISPDSSRIAFASNRTGKFEIWISALSGANPMQLSSLRAASHSPKWSPDGKFIAFSSLVDGNRDIYTLDSSGGSLRRLTREASEEGRPSWSRDGKSIYFYSTRGGRHDLWKAPASGGPAVRVTTDRGHSGEESLDGKELLYSLSPGASRGVFIRPINGGQPRQIVSDTVSGWWAITNHGLFYAAIATAAPEVSPPVPILLYDFRTGRTTKTAVIEKSINSGAVGLTASGDGRILVWAQTDHLDSDLMLVESFR